MENKRLHYIDYLRVFACLMVITIHISSEYMFLGNIGSRSFMLYYMLDSFSRSCIPIFLMITGALYLGRDSLDISKVDRSCFKLIVLYFVWNVIYVLRNGFNGFFGNLKGGAFHLWYLPLIAFIYALIPILRSLNMKMLDRLMLICITCGVFIGLFNLNFEEIELLNTIVGSPLLAYIGYTIVGYRLSQKEGKAWYLVAFAMVCISYGMVGIKLSVKSNNIDMTFFDYNHVVVFVESCLLFLGIKGLFSKGNRVITSVAKNSFGIYLVHIFILYILKGIGFFERFNVFLSIFIVFLTSYLISFILGKIKYLNMLVKI